jgi:hypothetical protein
MRYFFSPKMIRNQAFGSQNSSSQRSDTAFLSDFSDFSGDANEDPWYTSSPVKSDQQSSQQSTSFASYGITQNSDPFTVGDEDYSNEPPLLEELGIRFDHIWKKTAAVILLTKVNQFPSSSFSLVNIIA